MNSGLFVLLSIRTAGERQSRRVRAQRQVWLWGGVESRRWSGARPGVEPRRRRALLYGECQSVRRALRTFVRCAREAGVSSVSARCAARCVLRVGPSSFDTQVTTHVQFLSSLLLPTHSVLARYPDWCRWNSDEWMLPVLEPQPYNRNILVGQAVFHQKFGVLPFGVSFAFR